MVPRTYGTLKGLEATFLTYETYEEADKLAATTEMPNPMLEIGNASLAYRGPLDDVREIICALVEAETGIKRAQEPKTNSKGETVMKDGQPVLEYSESPEKYTTRVCKEKGWEDLTAFQSKLNERVAHNPVLDDDGNPVKDEAGQPIYAPMAVDIRKAQRKGPAGPGKLAQRFLDTARGCINAGKLDRFAKDFKKRFDEELVLPDGAPDSPERIEALGRAMKRFEQAATQVYA